MVLTAASLVARCPAAAARTSKLDRAAILRELQDFSPAGLDRRLGPDYGFYHRQGAEERFPEIWVAPSKQEPGGRRHQIGGPWTKKAGDFSSTQGQVLYTLGWSRSTRLQEPVTLPPIT
jgi:hypothetical protein